MLPCLVSAVRCRSCVASLLCGLHCALEGALFVVDHVGDHLLFPSVLCLFDQALNLTALFVEVSGVQACACKQIESPFAVWGVLWGHEPIILGLSLPIRCDGGQASRVRNLSTEAGTFIIDAMPELGAPLDHVGGPAHVLGGVDEVRPQFSSPVGHNQCAG